MKRATFHCPWRSPCGTLWRQNQPNLSDRRRLCNFEPKCGGQSFAIVRNLRGGPRPPQGCLITTDLDGPELPSAGKLPNNFTKRRSAIPPQVSGIEEHRATRPWSTCSCAAGGAQWTLVPSMAVLAELGLSRQATWERNVATCEPSKGETATGRHPAPPPARQRLPTAALSDSQHNHGSLDVACRRCTKC